jgi:hypothetical protein
MGEQNARLLPYVTALNIFVVALMLTLAFTFRDEKNTFLRFGPHDDLVVVSVRIDNWGSYVALLSLLLVVTLSRAYTAEVGNSIGRYLIYDMNTQHIKDISMLNLVIYSNAMYFFSMVRDMLLTLVGITQIDLSLWTIVIYTFVQIAAIIWLLRDKKFDHPSPPWTSCCNVICLCFCTPGTLINLQAYKVTQNEEEA